MVVDYYFVVILGGEGLKKNKIKKRLPAEPTVN